MTDQTQEIAILRERLEKIDNQRHAALHENHRLGLVIDEYRKQIAGQFVTARDLRDWFAGLALPQFVAINDRVTAGREDVSYASALRATAQQAYALADAMMAERLRGQTPAPSEGEVDT
ncbi:hypothetical protein GGE50_006132 [Rhizobium leguminosarum]|uniref:hypothetical protein n=1 Tax=Rhizobium leguminosarum TaxID=384 RepID=UPI001614117E|nr:hypothetical protein [Rhizobium leguminosarum]MBB4590205.1 hypothetical protein [Rhizobium leguminosarum]